MIDHSEKTASPRSHRMVRDFGDHIFQDRVEIRVGSSTVGGSRTKSIQDLPRDGFLGSSEIGVVDELVEQ